MWQRFYRICYVAELCVKMFQMREKNGEWYELAKWNGIIVINTDTFKPDWTTHIKSNNRFRWEELQSLFFATHRERLMALEAWLRLPPPASPNFPPL